MSERVRVRVSYENIVAFEENGRRVEEIIEKDTGRPLIQTTNFPPFISPQELTQGAIEELKAINGVHIEDVPEDK
ncbi:hypothetical protein N7491_008534 [Penicillium cf. griseofulvum]|uniref:Uncharacterized protein n=1 Tax=Penicillium cf. griseofulvum TaxID=2972120 RepID=A0A9W9JPF7_9EURO|nr:hypothetical protein N7472_005864 [Penicillium cf. griseofulvum]KAJ5423318.1 hypothetical protein N7491_008534 [Penicillium cf. griseofulvum]KAJ5431409.1 hypothetical protein N7445_009141 [Penicillium cf. griseofulvum]